MKKGNSGSTRNYATIEIVKMIRRERDGERDSNKNDIRLERVFSYADKQGHGHSKEGKGRIQRGDQQGKGTVKLIGEEH